MKLILIILGIVVLIFVFSWWKSRDQKSVTTSQADEVVAPLPAPENGVVKPAKPEHMAGRG